jgi:hypothetical protein
VPQAVGPVGGYLRFEDGFGRDVGGQRLARLAEVEEHDPGFPLLRQEQLLGRAEHALGELAGDLAVPDQGPARHPCPGQRDRHQRTRDRVRRAGDDLPHLTAADVDLVDPERLVGARVVALLEDAADPDLGEVEDHDRLDLGPRHGEQLGRHFRRQPGGVEVFAEPLVADLHACNAT